MNCVPRRVVITACGTILPAGCSFQEISDTFDANANLFCASSHDPDVTACPVRDFELKSFTGRFKNSRYLSRAQQLTLAATLRALQNADLRADALETCGLYLGVGPNLEAHPVANKALWLLDFLPNTLASAIAQITGIRGENTTLLTACAASTQAIGQAWFSIRHGLCDLALAGGGDSRLSAPGIDAYKVAGVLATGTPDHACRPFDLQRTGFAIGEGAAMFVLESLEHATRRNAPILAEICGTGSSLDGIGMTRPDPDGNSAASAVRKALGGIEADVILAHGTGTRHNDAMEAELIRRVHPNAKAVTAFKSWIGHLAAGCGAAELALGLACAQSGIFAGIRNLTQPCDEHIPLLRQAMSLKAENMLLHSFGFGGQNAALLVRPW